MPASNMLDIAIGIAFVFAALAVIASALTEAIATVLSLRAITLRQAVERLLKDRLMTDKLYHHPLIDSLTQDDDTDPAYIPSDLFARALLDVIVAWNDEKDRAIPPQRHGLLKSIVLIPVRAIVGFARNLWPRTTENVDSHDVGASDLETLRKRLSEAKGMNPGTRAALLALISDDQVKTFGDAAHRVATWFDRTMEGVGGWYKRTITLMIALVALVLSVALNVDFFLVVDSLSKDAVLRQSVATLVSESIKAGSDDIKTIEEAIADRKAAAKATSEEAAAAERERKTSELLKKRVAGLKSSLDTLTLPIGWPEGPKWVCRPEDAASCDRRLLPTGFYGWARRIAGWLFTAVAISLGAPFWFDLLNKFINLRAAAPPPAKAQPRPVSPAPVASATQPATRSRSSADNSRSDAPPPLS